VEVQRLTAVHEAEEMRSNTQLMEQERKVMQAAAKQRWVCLWWC